MNINQLMQQAQKMQEQMQKKMSQAQEELAKTEVIGESGAGLVKITRKCWKTCWPQPSMTPCARWMC